jgi:lipoprotein-anchoring transpeptidase ErfK/SrfK
LRLIGVVSMSVSVRFIAAVLALLLTVPVEAAVLVITDKSAQSMTVEVDGVPRYQWPISSGRRGYATPSGTYTPFRLEEDHYSREWDDAPMPHSLHADWARHPRHL